MEKKIKKAILVNVLFMSYWIFLIFVNWDRNKDHEKELIFMFFMAELSYWAVILLFYYLKRHMK